MQPQYSQKEDKYEEEIKVLTDKLKEVGWLKLAHDSLVTGINAECVYIYFYFKALSALKCPVGLWLLMS